jgi:hypothetical protein
VPTVGTAAANTAEFGNVQTGIDATVREIKNLGLTSLAHETPQTEISQIAASPWASSHYGGPGGPNLANTFSSIFTSAGLTTAWSPPSGAVAIANTVGSGSAADAGSYTLGNAYQAYDTTLGYGQPSLQKDVAQPLQTAVGAVPAAISSTTDALKFLTSWRFAEIVGGSLLLLVGLILVGRSLGISAPQTPASKLADYAERQPTSREAPTRMQSHTLEVDKPRARRPRSTDYGDVPYSVVSWKSLQKEE